MSNNDWLNPKKFEEEFGISESTQARYRSDKKIPYSKMGNFIYYSRAKIYAWFEQHSFETQGV